MKPLRYGSADQEKPGLLGGEGRIRDLSAAIDDLSGDVLTPEGLAAIALDPTNLPLVEGSPRFGPCAGRIGKFVCIELNYVDHTAETGAAIPTEPIVFDKWTSVVSGPNEGVEIPSGSAKTDWDVELGIVIGKGGKYIEEADTLSHVAGYCVVNHVSEREWQIERSGTWDKGKGFDTFGPTCPWLVTPDEAGDVGNLSMWLEVDGHRYQDGSISTMIFGVAHIVSYPSRFLSLQPGDVISTSTPPGVGTGQKPPVYLKGSETIRLDIEGFGEQTQKVRKG